VCFNKDKLSSQRKLYFDFDIRYENQLENAEKFKSEVRDMVHEKVNIDPGKIYVLGDKQFISLGKDIDDPLFWVDFEYFRAYTNVEWKNNL
jgi:hypothetical protein